jgi:solute carrier family 25 (adenine nucleotide translocator) protein 4/5/6/31
MDPASSPPPKPKTAVKDCIAGACAGAVAKTAVAPIERVKLLMQLQFSIDKPSRNGQEKYVPSRTSAWEVVKRVYREEGVLSFWRGEIVDAPKRL